MGTYHYTIPSLYGLCNVLLFTKDKQNHYYVLNHQRRYSFFILSTIKPIGTNQIRVNSQILF
jgi:hypothetical protein